MMMMHNNTLVVIISEYVVACSLLGVKLCTTFLAIVRSEIPRTNAPVLCKVL